MKKEIKINKKWLNRFAFLIIFVIAIIVMCVVCKPITVAVKNATDAVAIQFIENTKEECLNEINYIFESLSQIQ